MLHNSCCFEEEVLEYVNINHFILVLQKFNCNIASSNIFYFQLSKSLDEFYSHFLYVMSFFKSKSCPQGEFDIIISSSIFISKILNHSEYNYLTFLLSKLNDNFKLIRSNFSSIIWKSLVQLLLVFRSISKKPK